MSNQPPVATNQRGQTYRYWQEIFALAWEETELFSGSKILTTLGVAITALALQWEVGVRAFGVTLQIIGTVIAAYLCVALISFIGKLILVPAIKDQKVRRENEAFAEQLRPQLDVAFDENLPEFVDITLVADREELFLAKLYRVAVVSRSTSASTRLKIVQGGAYNTDSAQTPLAHHSQPRRKGSAATSRDARILGCG